MLERPKFLDSGYVEITEDGWKLKEGAPEEVRKEFEEFMEAVRSMNEE